MSSPSTRGPALVVRHTGQVFPLTHFPVTIGGQGDNTIVLADPEVSPLHAIIARQAGEYTVEDAGSTNGTFVNERRIAGAQPLRHGSVLRLGDTIFDVYVPAGAGPIPQAAYESIKTPEPTPAKPRGRPALPVILGLLFGGFVVVCIVTAAILLLLDQRKGGPAIALQSPREGAQVTVGQSILLQATATGARDITRLDLSVDGVVIGSAQSTDAKGQATLTASQTWMFAEAGAHTITVVAYRAGNHASDPVTRQVLVVGLATGTPQPAASETPVTPSRSSTPSPTGTETPTPTATPTETPVVLPLPVIEFFRADPDTINVGECSTLVWGQVSGAVAATIDHGIGGVATPGSKLVCPTETTTYGMNASGPGGSATASTTITVRAAQPDLTVESIAFNPNPPVQGENCLVRVVLRNAGTAAAGPFAWEWQPGSASPFRGRAESGLPQGQALTIEVVWSPDNWYTDLATIARVDVANTVQESNESNNQLQVNVQVVQPAGATVTLVSQAGLDGYLIGGQGSYVADEIRIGNIDSTSGERVFRGFLSFDLSGIPAGATIESAQLRFFQVRIRGNPYEKLGEFLLKHVDYGLSLNTEDWDGPELGSITLPSVPSPNAWYTLSGEPLIAWLSQDLAAGRASFQLRQQFSTETDGDDSADYVQLESGDNTFGTGNVPVLIVTYVP